MIGGVCGGIANWLGWDPTLVRVGYVLASVMSVAFPGMLVYVILWRLCPKIQTIERDPMIRFAASVALFACFFSACALTVPATQSVEKPPIISAKEWGSQPQPMPESSKHTPKFITIHHAGVLWTGKTDPLKSMVGLQQFGQKEKNWPDVPYHFVIAPDGRIIEGRSLDYAPDTNTKYSLAGNIGIELMGNFEEQRPSQQQLESVVKLSAWLAQKYNIDPNEKVKVAAGKDSAEETETYALRGHKDAAQGAQTVCPGKDFDRYIQSGQIRQWVTQMLKGEKPEIKMGEPLQGGPTTMIVIGTTQPASE